MKSGLTFIAALAFSATVFAKRFLQQYLQTVTRQQLRKSGMVQSTKLS